ncbi:MAG: FAD-binding oxidoreductase [Desulfobacterales bacterium]|nr:FAD-binding oxidoreductase [Desulfobacterales bacterium]
MKHTYAPSLDVQKKCKTLAAKLSSKLHKERLITSPIKTIALGTDAGLYRKVPGLVVRVENEEELTFVMAACHDLDLAFTFRGSGTSVSGQAISESVLIMLTQAWRDAEVRENGKKVWAACGITGGEVNRLLSVFGRKLGPDPASLQSATIGGMVANNSSGMSCGVAKNSQKTLASMRMILADGTCLDTADHQSREAFKKARPDIVQGLAALSQKIRHTPELLSRIQHKYAIKNTTGFSVNALVDHDDPIEMLAHLMVGSEGCLGFISGVEFKTVSNPPLRATAMLVFENLGQACETLLRLKDKNLDAAELMDRATLRALEDLPEIPPMMKGLQDDAAALLIETRAASEEGLNSQVRALEKILKDAPLSSPAEFFFDPAACARLWEIRDGFDPIICAKAPAGTVMISEDIALHLEDLAPAIADFHTLFKRHGYHDAVIFGHALAGNLHFVLLQDFNDKKEIARYKIFLEELVDLVVDKYDGSLKAEHGTGRNMAPFVKKEWGDAIYEIMGELKGLLDPKGLLNPGVILTDNPQAHITDLKTFPSVDAQVDACIECGFCERFCVANGLTLSARQRIVILRTMAALQKPSSKRDSALFKELLKDYPYQVLESCAADGLCAVACPSGINTGQFIKTLREKEAGKIPQKLAGFIGSHIKEAEKAGRLGLKLAQTARAVMGETWLQEKTAAFRGITKGRTPVWLSHMPLAQSPLKPCSTSAENRIVYFPSCINRTMGADPESPRDEAIFTLVQRLCQKAGLGITLPEEIQKLCCGLSFASKGMKKAAQKREASLNRALLDATQNGRYPVLCDMSPCLLHMRETLDPRLTLMEPVTFALDCLIPKLALKKVKGPVVVHPVCSLKKMGLEEKLTELAKLLSDEVVTTSTNCCGFAGDKGFTTPELNRHGLRDLKKQIPQGATQGYSTSRTCEIGLSEESGILFQSILYLVDEAAS